MSGVGGAGLPRSRVSSEQLDILLSFMEEHPDFAAAKQSIYSRFSSSKLWRLLAERLNAAAADSAGTRKSPDKWCRYWSDIKYKARKKSLAGGALGELSHYEERLQNLQRALTCVEAVVGRGGGGAGAGGVAGGGTARDEELRPDDDMCSEGSAGAGGDGGGTGTAGGGVPTEELLTEAALRSALAAEKQAEAVTQAVELLRELVDILRPRTALPVPPPPPPPQPHPASVTGHLTQLHRM